MKNITPWMKRAVAETFGVNRYDHRYMKVTHCKHNSDEYGWYSYTIKGIISKDFFYSVWGMVTVKEFAQSRKGYTYNGPGQHYSNSRASIAHRDSKTFSFEIYESGGLDI